jgi:hypothetical protein
MDPSASSQPPPQHPPPPQLPATTKNPVVAVGRKVKSVLSSKQRPSVRILRGPSSNGEPRRGLKSLTEKLTPGSSHRGAAQEPETNTELPQHYPVPSKENTSANRFTGTLNRAGAGLRSVFGREDDLTTENESWKNEYDSDTVDLLDVVGTYSHLNMIVSKLTSCRPRGFYTLYPHQCPEFTLYPFAREYSQSQGDLQTHGSPRRGTHN